MGIVWGVVVVALSLLGWGGQVISRFAPATAVKLALSEPEESVEPAYWADIRAEALWDSLSLWTLLVAGVLLIVDIDAWAYFGLVGGGMYSYFAGRGILSRREMQRRGLRAGSPENLKSAYVFLSISGVAGITTIVTAVVALRS